MKAFKKGDLVTHFGSWDNDGTIWFRQCRVYSCGMKLMILTDVKSGEEIGREFRPVKASGLELGTYDAMSDEEAESFCLPLGQAYVDQRKFEMEEAIRRYQTKYGKGSKDVPDGYVLSVTKDINELHEPRALNRTGLKRYE